MKLRLGIVGLGLIWENIHNAHFNGHEGAI